MSTASKALGAPGVSRRAASELAGSPDRDSFTLVAGKKAQEDQFGALSQRDGCRRR